MCSSSFFCEDVNTVINCTFVISLAMNWDAVAGRAAEELTYGLDEMTSINQGKLVLARRIVQKLVASAALNDDMGPRTLAYDSGIKGRRKYLLVPETVSPAGSWMPKTSRNSQDLQCQGKKQKRAGPAADESPLAGPFLYYKKAGDASILLVRQATIHSARHTQAGYEHEVRHLCLSQTDDVHPSLNLCTSSL